MRNTFILRCAIGLLLFTGVVMAAEGASVVIHEVSPGPTPFIAMVHLTVSPADAFEDIRFVVRPKPSSVARPISASYSAAYLTSRGYFDPATGAVMLPVFGLFAGYINTVVLNTDFTEGRTRRDNVEITTPPFATAGDYLTPTVVQPRSSSLQLSYDYIMLKSFIDPITPVIIDTDGEVRWIGTAGVASLSAIFFDNSLFLSTGTGIARVEFDGTSSVVADYAGLGIIQTGHHNYDPGKYGILVEVDTTVGVESTIIEIDTAGTVLRTWRLADIVSAAMIAGGDDPSAFVRAADDWFHNNAATYRKLDDTLLVSSRENFVIALDYESGAIKWILGDPTKAWYQYPSLRKYALTLEGTGLPPIGQHALSMGQDGDLLLFDNGRASNAHNPAGEDRTYSAARKYRIDGKKMAAAETWTYLSSPSLYSPYCSSVYEDAWKNYLLDYTLTGDVIGLNSDGAVVFHYQYSTAYFCNLSWNAVPIHLENVMYR